VVSDGLTLGAAAQALRRANPAQNAFFRVCTTDSRQGSALAQFARRKLRFETVSIVDDNETYGLDLANRFEGDFKALGGTILSHDHLARNTQDFKALLIKIAGAKPDFIFYGGVTSTGGGLIRKQMFDVGLGKTPFMGGDGISDAEFETTAGAMANGTYFSVAAPDATKLASAKDFVTAYQARFNSGVGAYSASGYTAAKILIAAIEKSINENGGKIPTRADVLKNVAAMKHLLSPIGSVLFDPRMISQSRSGVMITGR